MVIATYALVQLPLYPMLASSVGGSLPPYTEFVAKTFVLYSILKLTLVPAVMKVLERAAKDSTPT